MRLHLLSPCRLVRSKHIQKKMLRSTAPCYVHTKLLMIRQTRTINGLSLCSCLLKEQVQERLNSPDLQSNVVLRNLRCMATHVSGGVYIYISILWRRHIDQLRRTAIAPAPKIDPAPLPYSQGGENTNGSKIETAIRQPASPESSATFDTQPEPDHAHVTSPGPARLPATPSKPPSASVTERRYPLRERKPPQRLNL